MRSLSDSSCPIHPVSENVIVWFYQLKGYRLIDRNCWKARYSRDSLDDFNGCIVDSCLITLAENGNNGYGDSRFKPVTKIGLLDGAGLNEEFDDNLDDLIVED